MSNPGSATPTISGNLLLTVPTTSSQIPVAHLGNTGGNNGRLDSLDDRLYQAHIRNGRLWTAHNIGVDAAGVGGGTATTKRMAVRWYELNGIRSTDNGGVPVVVQSGTVFDNAATVSTARQFWIPSVMVSGQGHAALGFSTAGTTFHADDATVGRLAGDTLGTTQTVAIYTATGSAYNPPSDPGGAAGRRWGDYSYTSLDPLDDMTMWSAQEFCDSANSYGVRVVKLIAPPPATPSSTNQPGGVAAGQSSVNVVITGTSAFGSGFYDPGANLAAPALPFTHLSASVGGGVTVNSATFNSPTQVTLNISTVGAALGPQNVTITNPDGQSATGIGLLTITGAAPTATPYPDLDADADLHGDGNPDFDADSDGHPDVDADSDGDADSPHRNGDANLHSDADRIIHPDPDARSGHPYPLAHTYSDAHTLSGHLDRYSHGDTDAHTLSGHLDRYSHGDTDAHTLDDSDPPGFADAHADPRVDVLHPGAVPVDRHAQPQRPPGRARAQQRRVPNLRAGRPMHHSRQREGRDRQHRGHAADQRPRLPDDLSGGHSPAALCHHQLQRRPDSVE